MTSAARQHGRGPDDIIDTDQVPIMPSSYGNGPSLAERFRSLMRDGKASSPAEAVELLSELYYAFHFRIVQPLPGDPLFRLGADSELVVELDGRRLDPERILTREPGLLDPVPIPLDTYRWMCADPRQAEREALAELTIETPRPADPNPVPDPQAPVVVEEPPKSNANSPFGESNLLPAIVTAELSVKDRAAAAAMQMRKNDEIPAVISQKHFAKTLAQRIGEPSSQGYIRNNLKEWGLWPVAEIRLPKDRA